MQYREYHHGTYRISTDRAELDRGLIHQYLSHSSYWARGRTSEVVNRSIDNSLCFGLFDAGGQQVGFARVVTDHATFARLCDVFIVEKERGNGLGKWLVKTVVEHPELRSIRRIMLATRDAQELYRRYGGFTALKEPGKWMERLGDQQVRQAPDG